MQIAISGSFALMLLAVNVIVQSRIVAASGDEKKKADLSRKFKNSIVVLIMAVAVLLGIGYKLIDNPTQYEAMAIILSSLALGFIFQNYTLTRPHTDSLANRLKLYSNIIMAIGIILLCITLLFTYL